MKNAYPILLFISLFFAACKKEELKEPFPMKTNPNLNYFGYTLIDVGWDDPSDSDNKTNYIDEVHGFTNIADILVVTPTDNIISRMEVFNARGVTSILHLNELFFEQKSTGGNKSGVIYGLREDYQKRWDTFRNTNELSVNHPLVSCFYVGEEPVWNGIPESEFRAACDYVKKTVPEVPIFSVEASLAVNEMYLPGSVDWVGFDHYFLREPSTDPDFIHELNHVRSKMQSHQKMFLIMDAHWIKILHGSSGISKNDMDFIARDYYKLANSDTSIIGILGYFWPSGFDIKKAVGARHLPEHVLKEHKRIGKSITGK